jgi:hypothetical protein
VVAIAVFMAITALGAQRIATPDVYPQSKPFPLALYSIHQASEMQEVRQSGWNIAHSYHFNDSFLAAVAEGGMLTLASLPGESEPIPEVEAAQTIAALASKNRVAWWNFPEERRYWKAGEMALIANYAKWTRKYDPKKRPNYMYIPGHYDAEAVSKYVPYLDIIPASIYTTYAGMPHAWVRWRMETTIKGIELAKAKIGSDYLNGEKIPVAVLELFNDRGKTMMTSEGAYHDFWQSIVSGARGILIFSYWHKRDHPNLKKVWQTYNQAATEIAGPEQLGAAILYGHNLDNITFAIAGEPKRTNAFQFDDMTEPLSFPAIHILTKVWNKNIYLIAVNSAEQRVSVKFIGLPKITERATVLFENRTVPVTDGTLNADFQPLGVHIFKIASSSQTLKSEDR